MLNLEPNNNENKNPNANLKRKKKKRGIRLYEMTSDPKSFSLLLFLALFFITTSYVCLSDEVQLRNEKKMEVSRLWRQKETMKYDKNNQPKKKGGEEKKKKIKIFSTSLRQAINKERKL